MNPPADNSHDVRRVVLPSGREIESCTSTKPAPVDVEPTSRARGATFTCAPTATGSGVSAGLGGGLPDPVGTVPALPQLRVDGPGVFDQPVVDRFDEQLDRGTECLIEDLSASCTPTWRTRSSASRPRSPRTSFGRWTSSRSGPPRRRPPARARRRRAAGSSGRSAFASATIASASPRATSSAPVAAIASHTASASSGVLTPRRSSAASSGSRSRATISGSVTVPSSRSAPRCLPVRSAGPETSSTSSSSWKASPIRRPNAPAARPAPALERA